MGTSDYEDLEQEEDDDGDDDGDPSVPIWIRSPLAFNILILLIYVAIGVLVLVLCMGVRASTAWYVIVQIVTTIGYGDVSVSESLQIFMSVYVLFGTAVIANVVNDFAGVIIEQGEANLCQGLRTVEAKVRDDISDEKEAKQKLRPYNLFMAGAGMYSLAVVVWIIFFVFTESCSCSYGTMEKEGCTASNCAETGYTLNAREAFYMAVITFSTVGFGDFAPKSEIGRTLGSVLMIVGVIAYVNFTVSLSGLIEHWKSGQKEKLRAGSKHFDLMDADNDGKISKNEFKDFMLVRSGQVKQETLDQINKLFDAIDRDKNGKLTLDEIDGALLDLH